jgi:zinc D-Ala-D-Ala carboxypeptidase
MSAIGRYLTGIICLSFVVVAAWPAQSGGPSAAAPVIKSEADRAAGDASTPPTRPPLASPFDAAATENTRLCAEMNWTFGGKPQRGVQIYLPLICQLTGAEGSFEQPAFAAALSRWQGAQGLAPRGVMDAETWSRMVTTWQGRRQRERAVAAPDQLVLVAAENFYDPERPAELRYVERETFAAYRRMLKAAAADPSLDLKTTVAGELAADEKFLKIISAYRSPEYQAKLRRQEPGAGRAALAVHSPHFTGRALDLYVGGEPVITKDANRALQTRTKVYQWLVRHAEKFGFAPYFYEPWHWEYRGEEVGIR